MFSKFYRNTKEGRRHSIQGYLTCIHDTFSIQKFKVVHDKINNGMNLRTLKLMKTTKLQVARSLVEPALRIRNFREPKNLICNTDLQA